LRAQVRRLPATNADTRLDDRHLVSANKMLPVGKIGTMVQFAPRALAIAMFCVSAFVKSQPDRQYA
jgi:hypothetical protein